MRGDIGPRQREVARRYFGTEHVLSQEEMASLLAWLDEVHSIRSRRGGGTSP